MGLNPEVCARCYRDTLDECVLCFHSESHDDCLGTFCCPVFFHMRAWLCREVPEDCLYRLEHLVSESNESEQGNL